MFWTILNWVNEQLFLEVSERVSVYLLGTFIIEKIFNRNRISYGEQTVQEPDDTDLKMWEKALSTRFYQIGNK